MKKHSYSWPPMLDCDKFPLDNDMCITSQAEAQEGQAEEEGGSKAKNVGKKTTNEEADKKGRKKTPEEESTCKAKVCNQTPSYESIMTNFCQADFAVKVKFKLIKKRSLHGRRVNTVYKTWRGTPADLRKLRKPQLELDPSDECCSQWIKSHSKKTRFLVMGKNLDNSLVPTFIVPWSRDKEMKRARRMFKLIDCSEWEAEDHAPLSRRRRDEVTNRRRHQRKRKLSSRRGKM